MTAEPANSANAVGRCDQHHDGAVFQEVQTEAAPQSDQAFTLATAWLQQLQEDLPAERFTLDWLLTKLGEQSFGVIILMLAILSIAPPLAIPGGLLLLIPAVQMIAGRSAVYFPAWIVARPLPSRPVRAVLQHAIPALKFAEKLICRRPPMPGRKAKRLLGVVILLLAIRLVTHPIPLSNILPAILTALIALAYLEEDGLMLSAGVVIGLILLAADAAILWKLAEQIRWPDFHQAMLVSISSTEPRPSADEGS